VRRCLVRRLPEPGSAQPLERDASHHLLVVCRHPRGEALVLFDGEGLEVDAVLSGVERELAWVTVTSAPRQVVEGPALHLLLALPKGPALDNALRMAVEVGATHLHPVTTERTVPKGDHRDRWERIAAGAARQCGRAVLPVVSALAPLQGAAAGLPASIDRRVAVPQAETGGRATGPAALAVGPEGGFTPGEVEWLLAAGWTAVGLGPWVLRVDTAVAVGLSALRAEPRNR
jgi:16S rRNA (uracil1498-N3)-methyltransferase